MVKILSVSFRNDELERITELMKNYNMNRHQIIKLAVRRFLFPQEQTVPLNGKKISCTAQSQKATGPLQKQDWDIFEDEPTENTNSRALEQNNDDTFP